MIITVKKYVCFKIWMATKVLLVFFCILTSEVFEKKFINWLTSFKDTVYNIDHKPT